MTGILGIIDPNGVDQGLLAGWAEVAAYRGRPEVVTSGTAAFGALVVDGERDPAVVSLTRRSLFVADARIDATLGPLRSNPAEQKQSTPHLLDSVLEDPGPDGLNSIAADFAVARFDVANGELILARDAFGMRPLYWARRAERIGFASDPRILVSMGLVTGELDVEALRRWLVDRGDSGHRTAIEGIARVEPGHAVRVRGGAASAGRWFRPERIRIDRGLTLEAAATEAREAIVEAVTSRCEGRTVALTLSGGRDSSALAVALAEAGIKATCLTYVLEGEGVPSEAGLARDLARSLGHAFREVSVPPRLDQRRVHQFAEMAAAPLQAVGIPIQLAIHDALRTLGAEVVVAGEIGDLLFMGFPITVFDLVRERRPRDAILAARNYHRLWTRSYGVSAKVGLRALAPRAMLQFRERLRERAPWLRGPAHWAVAPIRTDRMYLLDLLERGFTSAAEVPERVFAHAGARLVWPMVDLRVVRLGVRLPPLLRTPIPGPKPVLAAGLLAHHDERLVKAPLGGFVKELLRNSLAEFPKGRRHGSLAAGLGIVREDGLDQLGDDRWAWESADLLGLEVWLQDRERHGI